MWKLKEFFVLILVPILIQGIANKKEQIESQLKNPFEENRKSDKFVLIGHSDANEENGNGRYNSRTRKYYHPKDQLYHKKFNLIDENSKELMENEVEEATQNFTHLNKRSGYTFGRPGFFGGSSGGFGHGFSSGLSSFGGAGLAGLGLGSLHLLDPLLLLATLSFLLFLVNSVITLVERLRLPTIPIAARREFFTGEEINDNSTHITQEILNDMEIFFQNLLDDYESKLKNSTTHSNSDN